MKGIGLGMMGLAVRPAKGALLSVEASCESGHWPVFALGGSAVLSIICMLPSVLPALTG